MVDRIVDYIYYGYDLFVEWYGGLSQVAQYGFIFFSMLAIFTVIVLYVLSRITR
jgi:hypothetical protein